MRVRKQTRCLWVALAALSSVLHSVSQDLPAGRYMSVPLHINGAEVRAFRGFDWHEGLFGNVVALHPEVIPLSHALLTTGLQGDGWTVEYAPSGSVRTAYAVICRRSRRAEEASMSDLASSRDAANEYTGSVPPACDLRMIDLYGCNATSSESLSRMISFPSLRSVALPFVLRFTPVWSSLRMAPNVSELVVYNQNLDDDFFQWLGRFASLEKLVLVNCLVKGSSTRTAVRRLILVRTRDRSSSHDLTCTYPELEHVELVGSSGILESHEVLALFSKLNTAVYDHVLPDFWRFRGQRRFAGPVTNGVGRAIDVIVRPDSGKGSAGSEDGRVGPSPD